MNPTPTPPEEELTKLYQLLVRVRQLDIAAVRWQRQGIIPGYAPLLGQEAAQVGSGYAVDTTRDFVFPTYREMGVARAMNVDMVHYMATHKATWHGGLYDPAATRLAPIQAVVAGSVLHAVGWAHGQTLAQHEQAAGDGSGVALTYFGDGASSQGDVHEAMNFAAVMKAPVVFFVQNNGWAISVPTAAQVAGGTVAARAAGYGMPSLTVDGNDVVSVLAATRQAIAHCRAGNGPMLIEANTYRLGPHSTSDDPGRYRSLKDEQTARSLDPVQRCADLLRTAYGAGTDYFDSVFADAEAETERVREGVESLAPRPGADMFKYVFQETTPALQQQETTWREESEHV
ncbi:pyruvate dehydrogenase E1 component alpha subunit [Arthrobacter sp. CAN_A212]|uniref:thiamine pyrophosphate-dependent enzyme n=1 Tax=unclassified Arthrobacter TaxID=235627 RepID=UPI0018CAF01D|nr:thiamine pyrophosphate-dependent enzyme [Arthrobacter sp. CAN_C5]MBP2216203.1 pyruvate dehydrogenase E1 component alpha subunit [Arthrobacter sp. CAN_C5]